LRLAVTVPWTERLGGAEMLLWTFLRHVDRNRISATVVFLAPGPLEREIAALGFPTAVIETGRLRQVGRGAAAVRELAALLRRERIELLLDWSAKSHVYGASAAALAGLRQRTAWWQHSVPDGIWLDRLTVALPARVVLCSSQAAANAQKRLRPRRPAVAIQPGTELPAAGSPESGHALRHRLGIPDGRVVVGIVGRLQPWKRQDLLIEAVADAAAQGQNVHALVVGGDAYGLSPDYAPRLRALAEQVGPGRVTFAGQVADVAPYVQLMDVLVNASAEEPFGLVLIEAMAAGKPVVAFDSGGPSEIVEDGVSGNLLRGEPRAALTASLVTLANDPALRRRLGEGARRRWEQRYTAELFAERLTAELEDLAAHSPHGRGGSLRP
jgi:glycosyltransferase involved in cell wall biosynthesis